MALAPGVWLLPGRFEPGRQPDGNSLVLLGSEGLVVIDSGRHADHAEALLAFARRERRPIVAVVNTHWHLDHLGGNLVLRAAEPRLQSHAAAATLEATRTRFADEAVLLARMAADATLDRATRAMVETDLALVRRRAELAPDTVIEAAPAERRIGGRLLRTGVERAVSGGDLWLFDPESRILAVGDFVTLPVPFFDTACAEQWREALSRFEAMPWQRMVPGHGPPLDRAGFQRYGRAFERLLDCAASDQPAAACSRGWVADLGPLLGPGSERVVGGMLAHYLGTRLRVPDAERRRFCAR